MPKFNTGSTVALNARLPHKKMVVGTRAKVIGYTHNDYVTVQWLEGPAKGEYRNYDTGLFDLVVDWSQPEKLMMMVYEGAEEYPVITVETDNPTVDDQPHYVVADNGSKWGYGLYFYETGDSNIGRGVAYIKMKPPVKLFVKCDNPPARKKGLITPGKLYEVISYSDTAFHIILDNGHKAFCLFKCCAHLDNNHWTKVFDDEGVDKVITKNKVDYTKPIQYKDGSPAWYGGFDEEGEGYHLVTPKGATRKPREDELDYNYYDKDGKHVYGIYEDVVNVENVPTVEEEVHTSIDPVELSLDLLLEEAKRNKKGLENNLRKWVSEGKIILK